MKKIIAVLFLLLFAVCGMAGSFPQNAGDFRITAANGAVTITGYTGSAAAVVIPAAIKGLPVTEIGREAFEYCCSLTNVTIPSSVTKIGNRAFNGCTRLTAVMIPSSVTEIGVVVFTDCSSLTTITVDNRNNRYADKNGVLFDKNIKTLIAYPAGKSGAYTIPTSVTEIGGGAFWGCSSLTTVTIPASVTEIGREAFEYCRSLTTVTFTIPSSVTVIEARAFWDCSSLTDVTIPSSVTTIGRGAFYGCDLNPAARAEITRRFGNAPFER